MVNIPDIEWFTPARMRRGETSRVWLLLASLRPAMWDVFSQPAALASAASENPENIIDRFLASPSHRIVVDDQATEIEVRTTAVLTRDEDVQTEALADVYREQGLFDQAAAIYRRLSLENPEKSAYFAALIARMGTASGEENNDKL